jgi:hypothetical protein
MKFVRRSNSSEPNDNRKRPIRNQKTHSRKDLHVLEGSPIQKRGHQDTAHEQSNAKRPKRPRFRAYRPLSNTFVDQSLSLNNRPEN